MWRQQYDGVRRACRAPACVCAGASAGQHCPSLFLLLSALVAPLVCRWSAHTWNPSCTAWCWGRDAPRCWRRHTSAPTLPLRQARLSLTAPYCVGGWPGVCASCCVAQFSELQTRPALTISCGHPPSVLLNPAPCSAVSGQGGHYMRSAGALPQPGNGSTRHQLCRLCRCCHHLNQAICCSCPSHAGGLCGRPERGQQGWRGAAPGVPCHPAVAQQVRGAQWAQCKAL